MSWHRPAVPIRASPAGGQGGSAEGMIRRFFCGPALPSSPAAVSRKCAPDRPCCDRWPLVVADVAAVDKRVVGLPRTAAGRRHSRASSCPGDLGRSVVRREREGVRQAGEADPRDRRDIHEVVPCFGGEVDERLLLCRLARGALSEVGERTRQLGGDQLEELRVLVGRGGRRVQRVETNDLTIDDAVLELVERRSRKSRRSRSAHGTSARYGA